MYDLNLPSEYSMPVAGAKQLPDDSLFESINDIVSTFNLAPWSDEYFDILQTLKWK